MKRAAISLAIFVLVLVVLDLVVAGLTRGTEIADRTADIQHPTALLAKLDRLRTVPGRKIVLVGDSLVYGGILEEIGDDDWRNHELGQQLADEIEHRTGDRPFVMNLGMNGLLPADLEVLVPLVVACNVDWIVLDVHLRPFSADFSPADRQMSRPWLRELSAGTDGQVRWRPQGTTGWLAGQLCDLSACARNRGLVEQRLLSSNGARGPVLRPPVQMAETDVEIQSLVKLAQLKTRLGKLDLEPESPQVAALQRTLVGLASQNQRHIVFYAKENPELLPDVMSAEEYATRYERVTGLVREVQGPHGVFVPPVGELQPEHFVDFTHINAEGYVLLARRLAVEIN